MKNSIYRQRRIEHIPYKGDLTQLPISNLSQGHYLKCRENDARRKKRKCGKES